MLYIRSTYNGIDIPIQQLQSYIYPKLKDMWSINEDVSFDCYGRSYKNQSEDNGYIPEVYTGNGEYKEVFFDDTLSALSFFTVGNDISFSRGGASANVGLIFMVNVSKLYPSITDSIPDEIIRSNVQRLFLQENYNFKMTDFITGIDNVFKEYSGWRKSDGIKFRDMFPFHCFRIDFLLTYPINACQPN